MNNKKRAFITGITGQDGSYLSELLIEKRYEVHGFARRGTENIQGVKVHIGDLTDPAALRYAIREIRPNEIYNLGAQSHVGASFLEPDYTFRSTALPLFTILEEVRSIPNCKVYQASSSEMFGASPPPQDENTLFRPQSPYAIAKVAAHNAVQEYRKAYNIFASSGICFNHESPRRPTKFVTRKISYSISQIVLGEIDTIDLGNLDSRRDWGHAKDYVKAMWLMLQQDKPDDYVIATGKTHSVREFLIEAFHQAEELTGKSLRWEDHVLWNHTLERPAEVPSLQGDASKAAKALGWYPENDFQSLVRDMLTHDLTIAGII